MPADVPTTGPNLRKAGEKPPVMSIAATKHTPAGAKAFAKFFIQTIDWGYATTSTKYMRHYFQHSCVACRSIAEAIDKAARAGHRFIGDRFSFRRAVSAPSHGSQLGVVIHFDVNAAEVVDKHGKFVDGLPPMTDFQERIYESWNGSWAIVEMIPRT